MNSAEILARRFLKLKNHYSALKEYKILIDEMENEENIYESEVYSLLAPEKKAVFDAYLKRFSSMQDFLGAKIFPLLLEIAGIPGNKMSEVIYIMENEGIIDSFNNWVELREIRNELEHDYPETLQDALDDLKFCVNSFEKIKRYYFNSLEFFTKYKDRNRF